MLEQCLDAGEALRTALEVRNFVWKKSVLPAYTDGITLPICANTELGHQATTSA